MFPSVLNLPWFCRTGSFCLHRHTDFIKSERFRNVGSPSINYVSLRHYREPIFCMAPYHVCSKLEYSSVGTPLHWRTRPDIWRIWGHCEPSCSNRYFNGLHSRAYEGVLQRLHLWTFHSRHPADAIFLVNALKTNSVIVTVMMILGWGV
jgi:hypothetical protein